MSTKHFAIFLAGILLGIVGFFSFTPSSVFGATILYPVGGGTGSTTLSGILIGNGTSPINTLTIGTNLTLTGSTLNASSGGSFPFTVTANYNSTSTVIGFLQGLFSNSSTTLNGTINFPGVVDKALSTDVNGKLFGTATGTVSAGTGISLDNATRQLFGGSLTITNSGVISLGNGTGITCSGTNPGSCSLSAPVSIANGGTNATSIGSHMVVAFDGTRLVSTSTPTFAAILATSTATSTFLGGINLTGTDCVAIGGTCLQTYIQSAAAYKSAANYATAAVLPGTPTYSNGSSGVGATLTEIGFGALVVDGQTVTLGQRILVKNEATQANNGIYTVTTVGSGIASYLLTRSTDYNTSNDIYAGTTVPVLVGGTVNGDTVWTESNTGTITIGSSNITFIESSFGTAADTFAWPFTAGASYEGQSTYNSTSTGLYVKSSNKYDLIASSTFVTAATTTNATTTSFAISNLTSARVPFVTTGGSLLDSSGLTYSSTQSALTATYASTTAITASAGLYLPSLASCLTSSTSGFASACFDTTSKQLQIANGATTYAITATSSKATNLASTTLDAMGKSFNTASTTFTIWNPPEAITVLGVFCTASTTGTALIVLAHANGNITNTVTCTSGTYTLITSNTTWTQFEVMNVIASSTAGAVSRIPFTVVYQSTVQ